MSSANPDPYADVDEVVPQLASDRTWSHLDDLNLPPICLQCTQQNGLCVRHVPHVCPQLKQPSWHREAHEGERDTKTAATYTPPATPAVLRARRREERKARRRSTRQTRRMVLLIGGGHCRANPTA